MMTNFPDQLPHGDIDEIFDDVFFVKGQMRFHAPGVVILLTRAMTIIRDRGRLSLINSVRLDEEGLQTLDRLGKVENILRIGANHGRDDAFYSHRYEVPVWAPAGTPHAHPVRAGTLVEGRDGPLHDASLVIFETVSEPEAVVCLHRHGGILITCDCVQNMAGPDAFTDAASAEILRQRGFFRRGNIGPAWRSRLKPEASDFERILALPFQHLLPAHGDPLLNEAHQIISQTVRNAFAA